VVLVAAREIRERTFRQSFWAVLLLSAVAIAAVVVIPKLASDDSATRVAVVEGGPDYVRPAVEAAAAGAAIDVTQRDLPDDAAARSAVRNDRADVAVMSDGSLLVKTTPSAGDTGSGTLVMRAVREQLRVQAGLAAAGLDPSEATSALSADPPPLRAIEPLDEEVAGRQGTALVVNILLFILLQVYGSWVLTGVTEEKSSRVVEVLLSSVSARALLTGKLIGIGLVALLHGAVLATTGVIAGYATGASFLDQVEPSSLPAAVVWLVLGYAFYCCANAAAGSTVTRVEDAQGMAFPILLPILVTYVIAFSIVFADEVPGFFWVLAYLPPTSPVAMAVLQISGKATLWQGLLSMAICVVGIVGMARLAARIYEGSILRVGSRVPLRQALRSRGLDA
jgi:ABC-2 type transport system permease protein